MNNRVGKGPPPTQTATPTQQQRVASKPAEGTSLVVQMASEWGLEAGKLLSTLRDTAFRMRANEPAATDAEMFALLSVARHYNLNPFLKEIYAFRNKGGGISPIVGYDGWVRLVERQTDYEGEEWKHGFDETPGPDGEPLGFFYECLMYRRGRRFPISRRQYFRENVRDTEPWRGMPTRMLMIRAYIQSARAAFGFGGIYDDDEGEKIAMGDGMEVHSRPQARIPNRSDMSRIAERAIDVPQATQPDPKATEDQLGVLREKLAKTGVPDDAVLKQFGVAAFEELTFNQAATAIDYVDEVAP